MTRINSSILEEEQVILKEAYTGISKGTFSKPKMIEDVSRYDKLDVSKQDKKSTINGFY
jgi:peptide deformylase